MKRGAEAACLREPRRAAWAKNLGAGHRCITPEQADLKKHRGRMMKVWNSCLAQSRGKHLLTCCFPLSYHIPSSVVQWGRESINHLRPTSTTSIEMHRVSILFNFYQIISSMFSKFYQQKLPCMTYHISVSLLCLMMRVGKLDASFER